MFCEGLEEELHCVGVAEGEEDAAGLEELVDYCVWVVLFL